MFNTFLLKLPYFKDTPTSGNLFVSRKLGLITGTGWFWMESFYGKGFQDERLWWDMMSTYIYIYKYIWMFPKIGVPQNGWFTMENPIKMDDLGVPLFSETSIWVWCGSLFNNVSWHMRCFFGASLLLSWSPLKINGWKMDILLLSLFTGHSFVFRGVCCWCIHVLCSENDDIVTASNQTSSPWLLHCCISYW